MKTKEELNALKEEERSALQKEDEAMNGTLDDEAMEQVAGGRAQDPYLLKYLQTVKHDPSEHHVAYGEGVKLPLDHTVPFEDSGNVYVIKRDKCHAEIVKIEEDGKA